MEVYNVKSIDPNVSYGRPQITTAADTQTDHPAVRQADNGKNQGQVQEQPKDSKVLDTKLLKEATDEMNSIVQTLNTDIHFKLHDKTNQLMVQVVEIKDGKVLKEFPAHELLDVMAKIREYVGTLIDKKV